MNAAFFAFARTGDPNVAGLPTWPPFTGETSAVMHFDVTPALATDANARRGCTYWKDHHYYGQQS